MATEQDFDALVGRLNAATNKVATKLQGLLDQVNQGGISAEKEENFKAVLAGAVSALEALGADPADPVPEEPPVDPGTEA